MEPLTNDLFIFSRTAVSPAEFVAYWSGTYSYEEEHRYTDNINGPHTPQRLRELFKWKIGKRFEVSQMPAIERDFISRMDEAQRVCNGVSAEQFLAAFTNGGPIYRIYWAHCWQPHRFPIYDQHVHRAMTFLCDGRCEEIANFSDAKKIVLYVAQYLPFWKRFEGFDPRETDRALWAFGKFIKAPPISIH